MRFVRARTSCCRGSPAFRSLGSGLFAISTFAVEGWFFRVRRQEGTSDPLIDPRELFRFDSISILCFLLEPEPSDRSFLAFHIQDPGGIFMKTSSSRSQLTKALTTSNCLVLDGCRIRSRIAPLTKWVSLIPAPHEFDSRDGRK
jgi:hypothetical protein